MMSVFVAALVSTLAVGALPQSAAAPTPQDCVKAGRDFLAKRQREIRQPTSEIVRQVEAERMEMIRACGAGFDVEKAEGRELVGLVEMYAESGQPQLAERAMARGLASAALAPADRAELLSNVIRALLRQPKGEARNARAEQYLDELDALPDQTLDHKVSAHVSLNNYYRYDDIDAGITKHSTWLIEHGPRLSADQRKRYGAALTNAYVNQAQVYAGQGENDRALALLTRASVDLSDIPDVERRTRPTLDRYRLVGTPGAPIAAPVWLNGPDASSKPLALEGTVTYLQFTAHWCGPCKESYPGLQRLRARFAGRPFRAVLTTELYGYFESERNLTPEQEIARDREYYKHYQLDVPIAIEPARSTTNGATAAPIQSPNIAAYKVSGIPQIVILDARGNIRLIMIGYDDANEASLVSFIEKLLTEMPAKASKP